MAKTMPQACYEVKDCYELVNAIADAFGKDRYLYWFYNRTLSCPAAHKLFKPVDLASAISAAVWVSQEDPGQLDAYIAWLAACPIAEETIKNLVETVIGRYVTYAFGPLLTLPYYDLTELKVLHRYLEKMGAKTADLKPYAEVLEAIIEAAEGAKKALEGYNRSLKALAAIYNVPIPYMVTHAGIVGEARLDTRYVIEHIDTIPKEIWRSIRHADQMDFTLQFLSYVALQRTLLNGNPKPIAQDVWMLCRRHSRGLYELSEAYDNLPEDWQAAVVKLVEAVRAFAAPIDPLMWGMATSFLIKVGALKPDEDALRRLKDLVLTCRLHGDDTIDDIAAELHVAVALTNPKKRKG